MGVFFGSTEITGIKDLFPLSSKDITGLYFADTELFTVWGEYDGVLPAQYSANGSMLADYRVYGSAGGVGDRTGNLFNKNRISANFYINSSGKTAYGSNAFVSDKIPVFENKEYCLQNLEKKFPNGYYVAFYGEQDNVLSVIDPRNQNSVISTSPIGSKYFMLSGNRNITLMATTFTEGSTAPASYVPYGYEVPMSVQSGNLFDKETFVSTVLKQRCTASISQTGFSLTATGNSPYIGIAYSDGLSVHSQYRPALIKVMPDTKYTLSASRLNDGYISYINSSFISVGFTRISTDITSVTVTTPANTAYLFLRFGKENAQSGDVVNFDDIVINRGESASYQPYSNTTTLIYIGDEPLGEGEYVDYQAGKVYRMVNGVLTPTDPPVPLPALPTVDGINIVDYAGQSGAVPSRFVAKYRKEGFK